MPRKVSIKKTKKSARSSVRKTERSAVAVLMHWMREVITEAGLDLGFPDVDTTGDDRKSPDLVLYESRRSTVPLLVMEAKPPHFDVFNEEELKDPAKKKATRRKARFFAVTNFKKLLWYDTTAVDSSAPEEQQLLATYELSTLEDLQQLEYATYRDSTKKALSEFLTKLFNVNAGVEPVPKQPIDQVLITRLHERIRVLAIYYRDIIERNYRDDATFRRDLRRWFVEQGWDFYGQPYDFDKAARQTAYLLVNKILFYTHLQNKRPDALPPLEIPPTLLSGKQLRRFLQFYFDIALEIDYETVFSSDFIDSVAFPDNKEIIREVFALLKGIERFDLSELGYDIIGRIFEKLIPWKERHALGQYFTNADVVDIILKFCVRHEKDWVLDPSCGAGTFLVRAYRLKKLWNPYLTHNEILETLWGVDIAKFPAHLAVINLAINDLGVDRNYPNIIQEDFFRIKAAEDGFDAPELWLNQRAVTLGLEPKDVRYPHRFDAVIGNPPYTRQEQIPEIGVDKSNLIADAVKDHQGNVLARISRRAGIYAYFFVHASKILKEGGRFGFVTASAWLDVDYGRGLQEFLLRNHKIIAVIESKVERWFEQADVNTCIIILEKCSDAAERSENLVRFVYLKKPLEHFLPPADDDWEKEIARLRALERFEKSVTVHADIYENEELRVYPVPQGDLWAEGFDPEEKAYLGGKWGKYLRAPDIFFTILRKCRDKLVPLRELAEVRFGLKTGANDFFYMTPEQVEKRDIEPEYIQPVVFSLKEIPGYRVEKDKLKFRVLICHREQDKLRGRKVLGYIKRGEQREIHKRPTCRSREPWYTLGKGWKYAPILFPSKVGERMPVILNEDIFEDKKFYGVTPYKENQVNLIAGLMNSTLTRLFLEFSCRQLTGAQTIADIDVGVLKATPVIDSTRLEKNEAEAIEDAFAKLLETNASGIFRDIGESPNEVLLENVKPELRELDRIIMGDILGLTVEEQLEVYRAVVDLVRSRIRKSESVQNDRIYKEGIDVEAFIDAVLDRLGEETVGNFYREKVLSRIGIRRIDLPPTGGRLYIEPTLLGWRLYRGKEFVECRSEGEARYLEILSTYGLTEARVPIDEGYLEAIVPQMEELHEKSEGILQSYLEPITNVKLRNSLKTRIYLEIFR